MMASGKNKAGQIIVIEGIDGSGKSTQFNLLHKRLKKSSYSVSVAVFPRYKKSVWGKLVGEFLSGKLGKFETVNPYFTVLPYMIDEYTWSRDVGKKLLNEGKIILSDRYFTSNVHQISKLNTSLRAKYRKWSWSSGYDHLDILRPDLVIFLDVPASIAKTLMKNRKRRSYLKGKNLDIAEKNTNHQKAAYREYKYSVENYPEWEAVQCTEGRKLKSIEQIHDEMVQLIASKLKMNI